MVTAVWVRVPSLAPRKMLRLMPEHFFAEMASKRQPEQSEGSIVSGGTFSARERIPSATVPNRESSFLSGTEGWGFTQILGKAPYPQSPSSNSHRTEGAPSGISSVHVALGHLSSMEESNCLIGRFPSQSWLWESRLL